MAKGSKLKKRSGRRHDFKYLIRFEYKGKAYKLDRERVTQDADGHYHFTQAGLTENVDMLEHEGNVQLAVHRALASRLGITAIAQRFPDASLRIVGHIDGYQEPGGDEHDPVAEVDVDLGVIDEAGFKQLAELAKPTDAEKDAEKEAACDVFAIANDDTVVSVAASSDAAKQAEQQLKAYADKRVKDWFVAVNHVFAKSINDFGQARRVRIVIGESISFAAFKDDSIPVTNQNLLVEWFRALNDRKITLQDQRNLNPSEHLELNYLRGLYSEEFEKIYNKHITGLSDDELQTLVGLYNKVRNTAEDPVMMESFNEQGGVQCTPLMFDLKACQDKIGRLEAKAATLVPAEQLELRNLKQELWQLQQKLVLADHQNQPTVPVAATAVAQAKAGGENPFALMAHQRHLADPTVPPVDDLIAADDDDPLLTQWQVDERAGTRDRDHHYALDRHGNVPAGSGADNTFDASSQSYFDVQAQVRQERRAILAQRADLARRHPRIKAFMPSLASHYWATDVYFQGPLASIERRHPARSTADLAAHVDRVVPIMMLLDNRVLPAVVHDALLSAKGSALTDWPDKEAWPAKNDKPLALKALFAKNVDKQGVITQTLEHLTGTFQKDAVGLFLARKGKDYVKRLMNLPVEQAMFELQRDYFSWRAEQLAVSSFGRAALHAVSFDSLLAKLDKSETKDTPDEKLKKRAKAIGSLTLRELKKLTDDDHDADLLTIGRYVRAQSNRPRALEAVQRRLYARLAFQALYANGTALPTTPTDIGVVDLTGVPGLAGAIPASQHATVIADVKRQLHLGAMTILAEAHEALANELRELNELIDKEPGLRQALREKGVVIPALHCRMPDDAARLRMQLSHLKADMEGFRGAVNPHLAGLDAKERQAVSRVGDRIEALLKSGSSTGDLINRAQANATTLGEHIDALIELAKNNGPKEPQTLQRFKKLLESRNTKISDYTGMEDVSGELPDRVRAPAPSAYFASARSFLVQAVAEVQNSDRTLKLKKLDAFDQTLAGIDAFKKELDTREHELKEIDDGLKRAGEAYFAQRAHIEQALSDCYEDSEAFAPGMRQPTPGKDNDIRRHKAELEKLDELSGKTLVRAKKLLEEEKAQLAELRHRLKQFEDSEEFGPYVLHQSLVSEAGNMTPGNEAARLAAQHELLAMSGNIGSADCLQAVMRGQHAAGELPAVGTAPAPAPAPAAKDRFDQNVDTRELDALHRHQAIFDAARRAQHEHEQDFVKDPELADKIHEEQRRKRKEEIMAAVDADAIMAWRKGIPPYETMVKIFKKANVTGGRVMGALKGIYQALPSTVDLKGGPGALIAALIVLLLLALLAGVAKLIGKFAFRKRLDTAAKDYAMISMKENNGKVDLTALRRQLLDRNLYKIRGLNGDGDITAMARDMADEQLLSVAKHAWDMGVDAKDIIGLRDLPQSYQQKFDAHARAPSERSQPRLRADAKAAAEDRRYARLAEDSMRRGRAPQRGDFDSERAYEKRRDQFTEGERANRVQVRRGVRGMATGRGAGDGRADVDPLEAMRHMGRGPVH